MKEPLFHHLAWHASTHMISGIIVGVGAGFLLYHYLNFGIWIVILGFMFGMAAGFLNVYRIAKAIGSGVTKLNTSSKVQDKKE